MKALVVLVLTVAAGSGAGYLYGKQTGHLEAQRQRYELERRARIDSIRVADLVKDSTARALREASRVQDSAAAAQRGKRQAFTIVTDTTVLVVGGTTPVLVPPALRPMIAFVRGADAKLAIDSTWAAKVAADAAATAAQRDQWKGRALSAEAELARERHRFGLKTGIVIGAGGVLLLVKAAAAIVR